jgi:putative NIF3 family GTP cyclohydrolase 1 type 2
LAGVDLYLSGEASEQTFHSARENDISFIAAGHHATERYGVQALGDYLARRLPGTPVHRLPEPDLTKRNPCRSEPARDVRQR